MEKLETRVIELLLGDIAQKTLQIAQLVASNEALQRKVAELEARLRELEGQKEDPSKGASRSR